jgi:uncharacterized repeat protein (TIGR03943 family)
VTPLVRATTVLLVGTVLVRLTLTDAYQRYVRVGLGPWLLAAGVLLVLLGLVGVVQALRTPSAPGRPGEDADHSDHDHQHTHPGGSQVGWLLLAPIVALLLVTPPALGSAAVDRSTVTVSGSAPVFPPLPASAEPRVLTMQEFQDRALDRAGSSLQGRLVTVTGFVARERDGDGFRLARYQIACCAADAVAAVARVVGPAVSASVAPRREQWFRVTGTFRAVGSDGVPELAAQTLTAIPTPVDPYEQGA